MRYGTYSSSLPPSRKRGDHIDYQRFVLAEVDLLAEFLSNQDWPYHVGGTPDAARVREQAAAGYYGNDETRTFWTVNGDGTKAGLIRLLDLADDTPMFDLRIGAAYRGAGLGTAALRWLTGYLFTEFPVIRRIEGNTRQDNHAMPMPCTSLQALLHHDPSRSWRAD